MTSTDLGRSETVTFLLGEDEAELRRLRQEATRLRAAANNSAADADEKAAEKAEKAANKYADEAEERGVKVVMRSVGRKTWRRLLAENKPREDNELDEQMGANVETFGEAAVAACLASPTFTNDEERDAFLDQLSEAQFGKLEVVAFGLNASVGADPKARFS